MKAVSIMDHGGPEVLYYGEHPNPLVNPNEVIVRVRATSVNRLDTYVRSRTRGQGRNLLYPHILGGDASGDIVEIGSQVSNSSIGQRVLVNPRMSCGVCSFCLVNADDLCSKSKFLGSDVNGSYAEYLKIPATNVYPIDDQVMYEDAASIPTVYLPVWNILIRKAELKPWETVLVLSAASGVGTAAIQVAKHVVGANVIATTSTKEKKIQALKMGADHVIDYTISDITTSIKELTDDRGVDVVVDHVGAHFFKSAFDSLRRGGRYGICGVTTGHKTQLHLGDLFTKGQQLFGVYMGSRKDMTEIATLLNLGVIKPKIHRIFHLEQAAEAHKTMENRDFFGKMILKP